LHKTLYYSTGQNSDGLEEKFLVIVLRDAKLNHARSKGSSKSPEH